MNNTFDMGDFFCILSHLVKIRQKSNQPRRTKSHHRTRAFRSLTAEFFERPLSPQVRFHVLPVLSHSTAFPDAEWISALGATTSSDSRSTVHLLLSILRLTKSSLGKYSEAEKSCVLAVLSRVMEKMEGNGGDDDKMECDSDGDVMEECIELLNDKGMKGENSNTN